MTEMERMYTERIRKLYSRISDEHRFYARNSESATHATKKTGMHMYYTGKADSFNLVLSAMEVMFMEELADLMPENTETEHSEAA